MASFTMSAEALEAHVKSEDVLLPEASPLVYGTFIVGGLSMLYIGIRRLDTRLHCDITTCKK